MSSKVFSRVLVVGADWLGDVIFSTPLLRALKKKGRCDFLAVSLPAACEAALRSNPYVDRVIPYEERAFFKGFASSARFLVEVRRGGYDAALLLHRSATRAFLAVLGGVACRVGTPHRKRDWLLTDPVGAATGSHRVDAYLGVGGAIGVPPDGREVDFFVTDDDRAALCDLVRGTPIAEGRPYAVVHAGGNWDLKRWPVAHFRELVAWLADHRIAAALCGSAREGPLARELEAGSPPGATISLCGRTGIGTLAALMEKSRLVVSNDSGPLHIAAGLGHPLVGIYGPTSPEVTGPLSRGPVRIVATPVGCDIPCYFERCHHRVCMENLKPEMVIRAAEDLLTEVKVVSHGS